MPLPPLQEITGASVELGALAPVCATTFLISLGIRLAGPQQALVHTSHGEAAYKKPAPKGELCSGCKGQRKVVCVACEGRGRGNCVQLDILPKREFPQWCGYCRGTGMSKCATCFGTGSQQPLVGFRVPGRD